MGLQNYFLAQEKTKKARAEQECANANLKLAQIEQRHAEINSQHDPINKVITTNMSEREKILAIAFYVVVGRMPK